MPELSSNDLAETVTQVGGHWEALRSSQVLITGGTGFVGTWLLESFVMANKLFQLEARATVMTRAPERFREKAPHLANHPSIRLFAGDVTSAEFPQESFSYAIHAAADPARPQAEPIRTFDTIIFGTRRLLSFAGPVLFVTSCCSVRAQCTDRSHTNSAT